MQYAVLRALRNRIRHVESEISAELLDALDDGDRKAARLEDGTLLGKLSRTAGRNTPRVTDEHAFTEWVKRRYPDEITETVRTAFRDRILASAKRHGAGVDESTGEVVPGVELQHGSPYLSFRGEPEFEAIVADRWNALSVDTLVQRGVEP